MTTPEPLRSRPLFFAAGGLSLKQIGLLAAIYPGVWGITQLATKTTGLPVPQSR